MRATRIKPFTQWADIGKTERFIRIVPLSGYRLVQHKYDAYAVYLEPHASDEALGRALLDTLERSRFIPPRPEFSEAEKYMRYYWQKDFAQRNKTRREEYKSMDWCRAKRSGAKIEIHPHQGDMPEYFLDHPPEKTVVIPAIANAEAVGASARLALNRCTNTFSLGVSASSDTAGSTGDDRLRSRKPSSENTVTPQPRSFPSKSPSLAIGWKLMVEIFPLRKESAPSRNILSFRTASRFGSTSKTSLRENRATCCSPP
jgi:hypothetical protein